MPHRPGILVADPDRGIQRLLRRTFETAGYTVTTANTGGMTIARLAQSEADLVVLSIEFSDLSGAELVRQVRALTTAPIIALFYANQTGSVRSLLDSGANDCLEEPFLVQELAARARRLLLRSGVWLHRQTAQTPAGLMEVDPLARTVRLNGSALTLRNREFDLLLVLLGAGGAVVPFDEVLRRIWGKHYRNARQNLRRAVGALRERIETDPDRPDLLVNVRGVGYRLVTCEDTSAPPSEEAD